MKFQSDIDIDFADRAQALKHIKTITASIDAGTAHRTGVYVTDIPVNPLTARASIDYKQAEQRGYIKLDFLNVGVYAMISNEQELIDLMNKPPPWCKLQDKSFCEQLIHIGGHYGTLQRMPEPIDSIPRMMMALAIIRPGKRHLIGKPWSEVAESIWLRDTDSYTFKKSHACAYAHLVVVHMNLLDRASN